ncbi:hypothetical protein [Zavarzinia compransoris]|uniref:Lipoprotein n=1 Tax=Zavarzinia compransoris TaxID=1264899 RepID=A0A317EAI8_9PROT|nr:hypothetical protein [Zavarzinia compransoris]PWR23572.1 hypothetical protein DKG75_03090 [Zavarzinia compransoris]TDP47785.1 hypothetical protein DES42_10280 [Zavarzinia compransoris]
MAIVSQGGKAPRRQAALAAAVLVALGLAGCGSSSSSGATETPAVPCPAVSVLSDGASLTRFRDGGGQTPDDVVYTVEVLDAKGICQPAANGQVTVDVGLSIVARRGPAGKDVTGITVPYFLALTETNTRVISRASYETQIPLDRGKPGGGILEHLTVTVPLDGKSPYAFELIGGLQISAAELDEGRRRRGR